ncbi:MAG: redox-sensing transcriptional repressor Rex [Acidobacteriota bacterium]
MPPSSSHAHAPDEPSRDPASPAADAAPAPAPASTPAVGEISAQTLNRLSVYLRCLRELQAQDVRRISSQALAQRFHLSATQIRKDLARFGEFGIRGVGYEVEPLRQQLENLLGLNRSHAAVLVGAGNLGSALACFQGLQGEDAFRIVGVFDDDPAKIGQSLGALRVRNTAELADAVRETGASIGILTVPAEAAQTIAEVLVDAGVRALINFAPVTLRLPDGAQAKNVDLMIFFEELAFFLR